MSSIFQRTYIVRYRKHVYCSVLWEHGVVHLISSLQSSHLNAYYVNAS